MLILVGLGQALYLLYPTNSHTNYISVNKISADIELDGLKQDIFEKKEFI